AARTRAAHRLGGPLSAVLAGAARETEDCTEGYGAMTDTKLSGGRDAGTEPRRSVVTECDLPEAPEKVWKALTVPKLLAHWLPDAVNSEILEAEPNRLLRYRWPGREEDRNEKGQTLESVVTFEL